MLSLTIGQGGALPLRDQIVTGIKCQIDDRHLRPGTKLPSIRNFAATYRVSRFTVVDPSGNSIIYIRRDEPAVEYGGSKELSGLARAIEKAAILRDMKEDDKIKNIKQQQQEVDVFRQNLAKIKNNQPMWFAE